MRYKINYGFSYDAKQEARTKEVFAPSKTIAKEIAVESACELFDDKIGLDPDDPNYEDIVADAVFVKSVKVVHG